MPAFVYLLQNAKTGAVCSRKATMSRSAGGITYNQHRCRGWPISRAIRKHGADSFTHFVVEEWPTETEALDAERELIAYLRWLGASLYNATDGGEGFVGLKRTPEHCHKIGEANRQNGAERGAKISRALTGRPGHKQSEDAKRRIREAARDPSAEARVKIGAAAKRRWERYRAEGRRMSEEQRAKISASVKASMARLTSARAESEAAGAERSPPISLKTFSYVHSHWSPHARRDPSTRRFARGGHRCLPAARRRSAAAHGTCSGPVAHRQGRMATFSSKQRPWRRIQALSGPSLDEHGTAPERQGHPGRLDRRHSVQLRRVGGSEQPELLLVRDREHADDHPWVRGYEVELLRGSEEEVEVGL